MEAQNRCGNVGEMKYMAMVPKMHDRNQQKSWRLPGMGQNRALTWAPAMKNAVSGPGGYHPTCKTCGAELEPESGREFGSRRQYCSDRCRLLSWAARELLEAYREGRASGLGDIISELGRLRIKL